MTSDKSKKQQDGEVELKLRSTGGRTAVSRALWNVSLGGVFVEMTDALPFGDEVECEFSLPVAPRTLRCQGVVVGSTRGKSEGGPMGVRLRLMDIRIADMRALAACIGRQMAEG